MGTYLQEPERGPQSCWKGKLTLLFASAPLEMLVEIGCRGAAGDCTVRPQYDHRHHGRNSRVARVKGGAPGWRAQRRLFADHDADQRAAEDVQSRLLGRG